MYSELIHIIVTFTKKQILYILAYDFFEKDDKARNLCCVYVGNFIFQPFDKYLCFFRNKSDE